MPIHKRKILFIVFASLLQIFTIFPQQIQSFDIEGIKDFSASEVIAWAQVNTGQKYTADIIDSIKKNISIAYNDRGYFNIKFVNQEIIFSEDSSKVSIKLFIEENSPATLRNINIVLTDTVQNIIEDDFFEQYENRNFNKFLLEEAINDLLLEMENRGHPFAQIKIQSLILIYDSSESKYLVDVNLLFKPSDERKIDKIIFSGNTKTKDYVIERELRIKKGELYSQKKIDELTSKINRLGFFQAAEKPDYYVNSKNEGILLIKVKEKHTNNFDGIIGYIPPRTESEKGFITGLVNISMRNLFGTGRAAAFRWRRFNRESQELELKYLEPWVFGFPINLSANLFQRKQDTTYVQRMLNFSLEFLATENISASALVETESVIPTDNGSNRFTVFNSSLVTTGLELKVDTRDDIYSPQSGYYFKSSYFFSKKNINGPKQFISASTLTDLNLQKLSLDLRAYYKIFANNVISLGLNARELRGSLFEESDLFRLGGTNSLRGYEEDQFLGSRVFWSNLEYRFLLERRSYFFLFFDTGYFLRQEDNNRKIPRSEAFKYGYGLGINLETQLGMFAVSFALGKGDSFSDGKIHFGIINDF